MSPSDGRVAMELKSQPIEDLCSTSHSVSVLSTFVGKQTEDVAININPCELLILTLAA